MRNKSIFLFILLIFTVLAPLASAQTNSTTDSARLESIKERLMVRKIAREDLQRLMLMKKDARSSEIQAKRDEFKTKLAELGDQRKKLTVERIDTRLSTINENGVQRFSLAIEKLEKLLDKFSQRVQVAKNEGKNTTEAEGAVTTAELAINDAKEAVATQSAKDYTVEIVDETTLKNTVGQQVSSLEHDLKAVFATVKTAKQKVMDVARAVAKLRSTEKISTPSATVLPSVTIAPTI